MPIPNGQISEFGIEELFFSITDPHGIILAGNDVFVRVSQYTRPELIGKPHNIIRHPDMPKAVFYLLWNEIKAGRNISAYVKNMAKDGSYYWVYASVFSVAEGFLSVRLKPSSGIFELIPDVYQKALKVEKEKGMEASLGFIVETIQKLGFSSYQSFMGRALSEELACRAKLMAGMQSTDLTSTDSGSSEEFRKIYARGKFVQNKLGDMSAQLIDSVKRIDSLKTRSAKLPKEFLTLHYLGINLLATIERMGQNGQTLSQIVSGITQLGKELKEELALVTENITTVLKEVEKAEYLLQSAYLEAEMIGNFVIETLNHIAKAGKEDALTLRKLKNCQILFGLIFQSIPEMSRMISNFGAVVSGCVRNIETFYRLSSGMEFVRLSSKVETARLSQEAGTIEHFNLALGTLINTIKTELTQMSEEAKAAESAISKMYLLLNQVNNERNRSDKSISLSSLPTAKSA